MRIDLLTESELPATVGRYTLQSVLGEGGMARVFRAEMAGELGFRKPAAVKVVLPGAAGRGSLMRDQLVQEARLGGLLNHPNVVQTFDCGLIDDAPYVAMEFVAGVGLHELVEAGGPLPAGPLIDTTRQIALGLHHAHSLVHEGHPLPIVHRDVKPSNVLVRRDGVVKVMDFGIAKATNQEVQLTHTGMTKGTPAYMSPEQLGAEPLDGRSDLFALGALVYYLATGRMVFAGQSITEVIMKIVTVEETVADRRVREDVDAVAPGLGAIVVRLLPKRPEHRYSSGQELADDLADLRRRFAERPTLGEVVEQRVGATLERRALPTTGSRVAQVVSSARTEPAPAPPRAHARTPAPDGGIAATVLQGGQPAETTMAPRGRKPRTPPAMDWRPWMAGAGLVLLALGGAAWIVRVPGSEAPSPGPPEQPVDAPPDLAVSAPPAPTGFPTADSAASAPLPSATSTGAPTASAAPTQSSPSPDAAAAVEPAASADPSVLSAAPEPATPRPAVSPPPPMPDAPAETQAAPAPPAASTAASPPPAPSGPPVLRLAHSPTSWSPGSAHTFVVTGEAAGGASVILHWGVPSGDHQAATLRRGLDGAWSVTLSAEELGSGPIEYWFVANHPEATPRVQRIGSTFKPFPLGR